MSPFRGRKALNLGKLVRVNFTLRSVADFLRDWSDDGHLTPGRRPWSSISLGPRGFAWNSRRRTARIDLPGPLSYETPKLDRVALADRDLYADGQHCRHWYDDPARPCCRCGYNGPDETACDGEPRLGRPPVPERWRDDRGHGTWESGPNVTGGTTTRYLPDPVTDDEAEAEECPRCGAEPGRPCRTATTGRPTEPHMPRVELARLARAYPEPPAADGDPPPWGTPR